MDEAATLREDIYEVALIVQEIREEGGIEPERIVSALRLVHHALENSDDISGGSSCCL